jgi:hypothetical protein
MKKFLIPIQIITANTHCVVVAVANLIALVVFVVATWGICKLIEWWTA